MGMERFAFWRRSGTMRPMRGNELVAKADALARRAHRGQRRKNGEPFIDHVRRVAAAVRSPKEKAVALLHDAVEKGRADWKDLFAAGFPPEVVSAVERLTRRPRESYEAFVRRAAAVPLARAVKLADLEDSLDLRRYNQLGPKEWTRLHRHYHAWQGLVRAPQKKRAKVPPRPKAQAKTKASAKAPAKAKAKARR